MQHAARERRLPHFEASKACSGECQQQPTGLGPSVLFVSVPAARYLSPQHHTVPCAGQATPRPAVPNAWAHSARRGRLRRGQGQKGTRCDMPSAHPPPSHAVPGRAGRRAAPPPSTTRTSARTPRVTFRQGAHVPVRMVSQGKEGVRCAEGGGPRPALAPGW
eukprot:356347-Chlamydomonas_euryale.AAC.4